MNFAIFILTLLSTSVAIANPKCDTNHVLKQVFKSNEDGIPQELLNVHTQRMSKKIINEAQDGKRFTYWVDDHDHIHFGPPDVHPSNPDSFVILTDPKTKEGFIIKESGEFRYDPSSKDFIFDSKHSMDLAEDEVDAVIRKEAKFKFKHKTKPEFQKANVFRCTNNMAAQLRGDNFIKDGMIASVAVTTAGFVTVNPQILNPTDPQWGDKARLLAADLTGNTISSYVSGKVVKRLIDSDAGIMKDFFQRTVTDYATNIIIKRPIYDHIVPKKQDPEKPEEKSIGEKIVPYDTGFSVVRFFPKRAIQRWTMNNFPKLMLSSCMKNSKLSFIVGPRMIRIADQYTWGLIYQGGRRVYLNQIDNSQKEAKK
jgi:hypothetical protein